VLIYKTAMVNKRDRLRDRKRDDIEAKIHSQTNLYLSGGLTNIAYLVQMTSCDSCRTVLTLKSILNLK